MPVPVDSDRAAKTQRIRELNDALRTASAGGSIYLTAGVGALPIPSRVAVMRKVRDFAAFTPDNDPRGEHDFGNFDLDGRKLFWKIDYYSLDMQGGSEDPSDPATTQRVLTVMLAEEY